MRTILVDVDTQYDFCDPRGALYVRGAEKLPFEALVSRAVQTNTLILGSVDSHAFDAWEFAGAPEPGPNGERPGFPPHCVKGTHGWMKVGGTLAPRTRFVPNVKASEHELRALVEKNAPQALLFEKEVYSLFANPNAHAVLERFALESPRFVVFGVATDYCVKAAALGLVEWLAGRGEVWLVEDAIAAVDPAHGKDALEACAARGVRRVDTNTALGVMS